MSVTSERNPLLRSISKEEIDNLYALQLPNHIEGSPDELYSSPVRRTFCLIVLFDLAICWIFWIIYLQVKDSKSIVAKYEAEIVNYTFNLSMFDNTVLASARFLYLEITYGCVKSKYPWFLAVSTTVTSAFVVVKMVLYSIPRYANIFGYMLVLISFIISWTETMFLIYRVLPKEKAAVKVMEYYRYLSEQYGSSRLNTTLSNTLPENLDHLSSPSISDNEEYFSPRQTRPASPTQSINAEILSLCKALKEKGSLICSNTKDWKYISGDAVNGFITWKELPSYDGKIYKIECFLNIAPEILYKDLVFNVEDTPVWNPHVRHVKKIESISNNVDIIYNLSNEALKGYISPRDFVLLRTWGNVGNAFFVYMTSYIHDDCPPQSNIIRGEYGIGVIALEKSTIDLNQTKCIWIMNYDLKGNMFRSIVDRAMPKILQEMICNLRQHCQNLGYYN